MLIRRATYVDSLDWLVGRNCHNHYSLLATRLDHRIHPQSLAHIHHHSLLQMNISLMKIRCHTTHKKCVNEMTSHHQVIQSMWPALTICFKHSLCCKSTERQVLLTASQTIHDPLVPLLLNISCLGCPHALILLVSASRNQFPPCCYNQTTDFQQSH